MPNAFLTTIIAAGTTTTTTASKKGGSSSQIILIVLVLFVGVYFFYLRPRQQKARAQRSGAGKALAVGDEVVTIGGILGTVSALEGDAVTVEVAPGTHMSFLRRAVNPRTPATGGQATNPVADTDDGADYDTYDDEGETWEDEDAAGTGSTGTGSTGTGSTAFGSTTGGANPAEGGTAFGSTTGGDTPPEGGPGEAGDGRDNKRGGRGEGRRR